MSCKLIFSGLRAFNCPFLFQTPVVTLAFVIHFVKYISVRLYCVPDTHQWRTIAFNTRPDLEMLLHVFVVTFLIAGLGLGFGLGIGCNWIPLYFLFAPFFSFSNLHQHWCWQCHVSMLSVVFPTSSLALCSVSSDSAPAPCECFHSGLMGLCASHCSMPGDYSGPLGFRQVLLTVSGLLGLPALFFLPFFFVLCSDLFLVCCVLCRLGVITFHFLSVFAVCLCGCGALVLIKVHFETRHCRMFFVQFCCFPFFSKPTYLNICLDK